MTDLPRRARAALGLTAAVAAVVFPGVVPAAADPLGDARARAAALAATVDRLETRAEIATEHYNAIEARLAGAVTRQSLAERQAEEDQVRTQQVADDVGARVRAFYEGGGETTLFATVLGGQDPLDAMNRLHLVNQLMTFNNAQLEAAQAVTAQVQHVAAGLATTAAEVTRLQRAADQAATRIRVLLTDRRSALAEATGELRDLVEQRQAALAAASAAQFQSALDAVNGTLPQSTATTNDIAAGAIAAARTRLGDPYVWGATGPNSFDCSGLTQWAYAHVGISLPRVAADQWNAGPHVPLSELQPGDLLFWATDLANPATIHHVAIYLGGGMMLAAPHTGDVVKVQPVYMSGYIGATRPYRSVG